MVISYQNEDIQPDMLIDKHVTFYSVMKDTSDEPVVIRGEVHHCIIDDIDILTVIYTSPESSTPQTLRLDLEVNYVRVVVNEPPNEMLILDTSPAAPLQVEDDWEPDDKNSAGRVYNNAGINDPRLISQKVKITVGSRRTAYGIIASTYLNDFYLHIHLVGGQVVSCNLSQVEVQVTVL